MTRLVWIDWMKVWATLAVIWGHFFSKGDVYVYVFHLQVFWVISGFLYKKQKTWKTCIQKCFWQLLVPTVIFSFLMRFEVYCHGLVIGEKHDMSWLWFFKWLLLGHRWCMGPCWFFYSLIIIRLIMQLLPEKKWIYALLFMVLSLVAIYLHMIGFEVSNANVNVVVCMPFFLIGLFLKPLRQRLNELHNYLLETCMLIASFFIVVLCGHYNGYVWMYLNGYGNNYVLFIIGGMAGAMMLYVISLWLNRLPYRNMVQTLSKGSILIIGLHIIIVRRLTELPNRFWFEDVLFSIMILLLFIPIVRVAELFCPTILGQHKITR